MTTPLASDVHDFAAFCLENRGYHSPWEPTRDDKFYEEHQWEQRLSPEARMRWNRSALTLFFRLRDSGEIVGICHFSGFVHGVFKACYLGYKGSGAHQGRGYVREGARAAIDYVFSQWGMHRIQANYQADNLRSARLLKSLNFQVEGRAKQYLNIKGKWRDHVLTSLIAPA